MLTIDLPENLSGEARRRALEVSLILHAIEVCPTRIEAAKYLDMSRRSLTNRINQYSELHHLKLPRPEQLTRYYAPIPKAEQHLNIKQKAFRKVYDRAIKGLNTENLDPEEKEMEKSTIRARLMLFHDLKPNEIPICCK